MSDLIVIGDSCIDINYFGHTRKMSPEKANLQIFTVEKKDTDFGMAGNTFRNILNIRDFLKLDFKVNLITNTQNLPKKHRQYDSFGNMIHRFDEDDHTREQFDISQLIDLLSDNTKMVVISDYDKGFLSHNNIKDIADVCKQNNTKVIVDTKKLLLAEYFKNVNFIKLNQAEYSNNEKLIVENNLHDKIILTLGEKGCMYGKDVFETPYQYDDKTKIYPEGCGDTFVAGFVLNYLAHGSIVESLKFGMEMAGLVLTKKGVCFPY